MVNEERKMNQHENRPPVAVLNWENGLAKFSTFSSLAVSLMFGPLLHQLALMAASRKVP